MTTAARRCLSLALLSLTGLLSGCPDVTGPMLPPTGAPTQPPTGATQPPTGAAPTQMPTGAAPGAGLPPV